MRCVLLQSEPTWQDLASSRTALAAMLAAAGDVRGALVLTPEMAESGFTMHPERACEPLLGSDDGRLIFASMIHTLGQRPAALAA